MAAILLNQACYITALRDGAPRFTHHTTREPQVRRHCLYAKRALRQIDSGLGRSHARKRRQHWASKGHELRGDALGELGDRRQLTTQRSRQFSEQRADLLRVPTRDGPIELPRLELQQERQRQRQRDAVVVRAGIEAIADRDLCAVQLDCVREMLRQEALLEGEHVGKRELQRVWALRLRLLSPGFEGLAIDHLLRNALLEKREQRFVISEQLALSSFIAQSRHLLQEFAIVVLKFALRTILAAHERVLEEHQTRSPGRDRRVVDAATSEY